MGSIFKIPGYLIYFVGGLWGFAICLGIVADKFGTIGGAIALILFPFTLTLAPFYAGFANGNWLPLALVYGSGIVGTILVAIGSAIDKN